MKPRLVRIGGTLGTTHIVGPFGRWPRTTACSLRLDRYWHRPDDGRSVVTFCQRCAARVAEVAAIDAELEARRRRRCRTAAGGNPAATPTPAPAHRRAQNPISTEESCRS